MKCRNFLNTPNNYARCALPVSRDDDLAAENCIQLNDSIS